MALKFLNKKGWHTGSLRNIENVWKAEQKHEAEQRKLAELKKQIQDEREAQEFRLLQEQAGLVPKQERLEFLYDSGLAVGKSSTDDYLLGKPIEANKSETEVAKAATAPGALFVEEKPQSANDTWRKLHSDPLLLIRQQEQAALARIKNNPVKMDMLKKSVEEKFSKKEEKRRHKEKQNREHKEKKRKRQHSDKSGHSETTGTHINKESSDARERIRDNRLNRDESERGRRNELEKPCTRDNNPPRRRHGSPKTRGDSPRRRGDSPRTRHDSAERLKRRARENEEYPKSAYAEKKGEYSGGQITKQVYLEKEVSVNHKEWKKQMKHQAGKLSEEEKSARLKEMQNDAEVHEEQRWHRVKKASDADQLEEARRFSSSSGNNFLDQTARNIYGAAKGGSASVEESVRRRTNFIARSIGDSNFNTFQRS